MPVRPKGELGHLRPVFLRRHSDRREESQAPNPKGVKQKGVKQGSNRCQNGVELPHERRARAV